MSQLTPLTHEFISFLRSSPSQFHCISSAIERLKNAGFQQLKETDLWSLTPGKYYYTRNQSSLVAFALPPTYTPESKDHAFVVMAAHSDSPVLKVKPVSKVSKHGFLQVGVECYGGGLWHTWFDRDLSLAGRVILQTPKGYDVKLIHLKKPILRIPTLAIHLSRDVNDKGFAPNKQTHLLPILATQITEQLNAPSKPENDSEAFHFTEHHHSVLLQLLADELSLEDVSSIRDFELCLFDTQEACTGGLYDEFIFSRALDNQGMSFVTLRALIDSTSDQEWWNQSNVQGIRALALFDNEEVGSVSEHGAASTLLRNLFKRLTPPDALDAVMRRSVVVSADMAHACHPNYADVHEEYHKPQLHKGLVIKENANQRYATTNILQFIMNEIAKRHDLPTQHFVVKNDSACGSTIGPTISADCGVRTIDVGNPQLSMHSIREMCGTQDVQTAKKLFEAFYKEFLVLDQSIAFEGEEQ